jgi:hypothetical protein
VGSKDHLRGGVVDGLKQAGVRRRESARDDRMRLGLGDK